ncbi:carboxymuconolactone decarboxylase family protein [Glycomyces artemisiae]|uniref:AhpD family alkylhydroperoxidase n=2 Tax=Glycomyces artemisiae TaxID=1076443 RepID=A0A2T0USE0_9ACTN|nr:carboxymuconolactone decarboxylase family protein [Glycomyces artemisiae]PRY60823.1 AhpD family alkylhydroperoxidase [Glycomyces artemisiae]
MEARLAFTDTEFAKAYYKNMLANEKLFHTASTVPHRTMELVKLRASQINGCGFCTDMHFKDAVHAGDDPERLNLVPVWREAPAFDDAERAALALAEESARLADNPHGVSDETWEAVRKHYDDEQIAALVAMCAQINAWNRVNVILRTPAGFYDPATKTARYRELQK